jgi:hypothetical protein
MGFFGSFMGTDQKRDVTNAYKESVGTLTAGENQARGELNAGYGTAGNYLTQAGQNARQGYDSANQILKTGQAQSQGYIDPYLQSGGQANTMYGNALGLNGSQAQRDFGQNYAASDPFRQQNMDMANEGLMRSLNARGMSGSGYAGEAVARQSLERGSTDYQNYLSRLQGLQGQGAQMGQFAAGQAGQYAGQRAGVATGRGNALMGVNQAQAGLATDQGRSRGCGPTWAMRKRQHAASASIICSKSANWPCPPPLANLRGNNPWCNF